MRYVLLVLYMLLGMNESIAQKKATKDVPSSMMSGIILDEQNKTVPGAIVKITKKRDAHDYRVGEDGMYYSALLPVGSYHVDIMANNRYYQAPKVYLSPATETKKYYNFKLKAGVAVLYTDEHDPLLWLQAGEHVPQQMK